LSVAFGDTVRSVSDVDFVVLGVVEDVRIQLIIAHQVCDCATLVLDHVRVHNLISGHQPVLALALSKHDMHFVVLAQVVV